MNIYQRLAAAMAEVTYIQKEKKQGMRYTIVSHDAVTAKVRPVLLKHGIVYHPIDLEASQAGNRTQVRLAVRFVNVEDPTDSFVVPSLGYGIDDQDKGPGKAISYAVKYALLKALGLETGDDPEYDQETPHDPGEPEVFPAEPDVDRKSAHFIKKNRPNEWPEVVSKMREAQSVDDLKAVSESEYFKKMTKDWPLGFLDELRAEYQSCKNALTARAAA